MRRKRGVVLSDVLLVEGGLRVPEPGRSAVDGRDVDEEVRAAEVVVISLLLLTMWCEISGKENQAQGGELECTTAPKSDCISRFQKCVESAWRVDTSN